MSELAVKISVITEITPHPNADRLEVAHIGAWTTCVKKGVFSQGDVVVFIPPDAILPRYLHELLGITQYCAELPKGTQEREQGSRRVRATNLRGVRSFGTLMTLDDCVDCDADLVTIKAVGDDVADLLGITKYTPPEKILPGDAEAEHALFPKYTDIERYQNHPEMFIGGELVVFLEKLHGTNCRLGLVMDGDGEAIWMGGSHRTRRKQLDANGRESMYWLPYKHDGVRAMVTNLMESRGAKSVVVYCEIVGPGIQDMQYNGYVEFYVFDVAVDMEYLGWNEVEELAQVYNIPLVKRVYMGPFNHDVLMQHTDGPTLVCENPVGKFQGREGVVVRPIPERRDNLGQRVILKSVSADYLSRKGATDNA